MNQHDLYVYYKVDRTAMARHHMALQRLIERIWRDYSVSCTLRYRPADSQSPGSEDTWMEIWENVPPGFQQLLLPLSIDTGASACITGQRYFELFQTLPAFEVPPQAVADHVHRTAQQQHYTPPPLRGSQPSPLPPVPLPSVGPSQAGPPQAGPTITPSGGDPATAS